MPDDLTEADVQFMDDWINDPSRRGRTLKGTDLMARLIASWRAQREALEEIVCIKEVADRGDPLVSNQGQALDGYSELALYRASADKARQALGRGQEEGEARR